MSSPWEEDMFGFALLDVFRPPGTMHLKKGSFDVTVKNFGFTRSGDLFVDFIVRNVSWSKEPKQFFIDGNLKAGKERYRCDTMKSTRQTIDLAGGEQKRAFMFFSDIPQTEKLTIQIGKSLDSLLFDGWMYFDFDVEAQRAVRMESDFLVGYLDEVRRVKDTTALYRLAQTA